MCSSTACDSRRRAATALAKPILIESLDAVERDPATFAESLAEWCNVLMKNTELYGFGVAK